MVAVPDKYQCYYLTDECDEEFRRETPDPGCVCENCFYGNREAYLAGAAAVQALADEVLAKYRRLRQHVRKDGMPKVGYTKLTSAVRQAEQLAERSGMDLAPYRCWCGEYHLGIMRSDEGAPAHLTPATPPTTDSNPVQNG